MFFSTYLLSFQNEQSSKGTLARNFIASKSRARSYLGVLQYLQANDADDYTILLLRQMKKDYEEIIQKSL